MEAKEVAAQALFQQGNQLRVPRWQRGYSWDKNQWSELWADLTRLDAAGRGHFMGSVVVMAEPWSGVPTEARRFVLVDGQQRVTTLAIVLSVLRNRVCALAENDEDRAQEFGDYTDLLLRSPKLKGQDSQMLVLQDADQPDLLAVVNDDGSGTSRSSISQAFDYFSLQANSLDQDGCRRLISRILSDFAVVWVTLQEGDNVHRIFQTLNAGGRPLQQSDLVRNYFFLLLPGERGEDFYKDHWRSMEDRLRDQGQLLEDFFAAWMVSEGDSGAKKSLFHQFQKVLGPLEGDPAAVESYGKELGDAAVLYLWLFDPSACSHKMLRPIMEEFRVWGTLSARGLLLWLLRQHQAGVISDRQTVEAFDLVLSYFARRQLAGFEPNGHRSTLTQVAHELRSEDLEGGDLVESLHRRLSSRPDRARFPRNEEVVHSAQTQPMYSASRAAWVHVILERINRALYENKKHAPSLSRDKHSIEHVMPQTLTSQWKADLADWDSEDVTAMHNTRLHVLGNLTLTPINPELSNRPFSDKRHALKDHGIRLNDSIVGQDRWAAEQIDARSLSLATAAAIVFAGPLDIAIDDSSELTAEELAALEEELDDEGEDLEGPGAALS